MADGAEKGQAKDGGALCVESEPKPQLMVPLVYSMGPNRWSARNQASIYLIPRPEFPRRFDPKFFASKIRIRDSSEKRSDGWPFRRGKRKDFSLFPQSIENRLFTPRLLHNLFSPAEYCHELLVHHLSPTRCRPTNQIWRVKSWSVSRMKKSWTASEGSVLNFYHMQQIPLYIVFNLLVCPPTSESLFREYQYQFKMMYQQNVVKVESTKNPARNGIYTVPTIDEDKREDEDERGRHAVVLVGYGVKNDKDYYIVQNSGGDTWGLKGFIKV
ncbi:cathepsin L-like cysteine proteinase [Striga asiatica]|uniref:Cathepsin L-like cysteine proteinase n=1 Tax=Striga asiatica TaxID=4170 RepID=A0A5A7QH11_STRAF|nr:cathepsin L-like cysteine proteinase [Striga asiatica]